MASFNIHLSVAKRYMDKNSIDDKEEFIRGSIAPDLAEDDNKSHYSGYRDKTDILSALKNKVLLDKYLEENSIESPYDKGVFLHLITDNLFFTDFFDEEYLLITGYKAFCKDLYYSYDICNQYLEEKYQIDYGKYREAIENNIKKDNTEKEIDNSDRTNILPYEKLDSFIERVSNINLEEYKNKILNQKKQLTMKK